ncbi:MAG: hypothetical protein H0X03_09330 [Nitrosopumilus sp.]|nr:hypothetical protein [Nitrosopumilus sp.]
MGYTNNVLDQNGNFTIQELDEEQLTEQISQCISGGDTVASCENFSLQNQINTGNNALGQQGGGNGNGYKGNGGGNSASQGINQDQTNNQNSMCVSGGSLGNSCNNISVQNQANSGNNAGGQDSGNGKGGNSASQGINQDQTNNQNSMCVSGADATVSCNNVNAQNQANSGNNALDQQGGGSDNNVDTPQSQSANNAASPQSDTGTELINTFTSNPTAQGDTTASASDENNSSDENNKN